MSDANPSRSNADRAEETRARILDAATQEFSANGLAGARTERIAEAAGVNKALLYYYFRSKDALYAATLETVAARMAASTMALFGRDCSAGERLLRFALNHFDRIYSQPVFQTLMQQEMIRLRRDESGAPSPLVEKLFKPMGNRMMAAAEEGIGTGELVRVEKSQLMYAVLGPNVFYFLSAPLMRLITDIADQDPFLPASLEFRRRVAVEYLGQAIFTDRQAGASAAARVLADTPMPEQVGPAADPICRVKIETRGNRPAATNKAEVRTK
jgi:TetR/AcrR family transcriptional regulator